MNNTNTYPLEISELFKSVPEKINPFICKLKYAWEIVPEIKKIVRALIDMGLENYTEISPDVWVASRVKIAPTATIEGPTIISSGTEIRPGAYIRGNVFIGENCVVGNSTELKNAILFEHVQVPHYNYVGDSVLGNYAHMGAGSICSNLKGDGKNVVIHAGEANYETGLRKLGAILGDHADIGCQSVLNPGTIVGPNTRVYPLTMMRGAYPSDSIVKSTREISLRRS